MLVPGTPGTLGFVPGHCPLEVPVHNEEHVHPLIQSLSDGIPAVIAKSGTVDANMKVFSKFSQFLLAIKTRSPMFN